MHHKRDLGLFSLSTIAIAAIFSLRSLPLAALYGVALIPLYLITALLFFIPGAIVCIELTNYVPQPGGLYAWVRAAFGEQLALVAIWLEWCNTVISFPTMLTFCVITLSYVFAPDKGVNRFIEIGLLLGLFWGLTLINFLGIKISTWFSSLCVLVGMLVPAILIVVLGAIWFISGHRIELNFSASELIPRFHSGTLTFLITITTSLSGIQVIAFHRSDCLSLKRNYLISSLLTVAIVLSLLIFGALSIAIVVPSAQLNLASGLIASLSLFFNYFHLDWLLKLTAILIGIGVLSEVNVWLISPSKGLYAAAENGLLPEIFYKQNKNGAPTTILILQGCVFSLLTLIYLFVPSMTSGYLLLSIILGQLTLLMWVLIFASAIRLRYKRIQNSSSNNNIKKNVSHQV